MKKQLPPDPEGMNDRRAFWADPPLQPSATPRDDFEDAVWTMVADLLSCHFGAP